VFREAVQGGWYPEHPLSVELRQDELHRLVALDRKFAKEGLTFDDVLLVPAESSVLPNDVSTRTRLTRTIELSIPVVSAAMDTVTEARLAIALAREGGIGILHRNLSIEDQVAEVDKVKRSEAGMIVEPVTLPPGALIRDALELMAHYKVSGVPITDDVGVLVGILTNRDLRFEVDVEQPVSALMTSRNLVTAPVGTTLEEAKEILHRNKIEKLPVVDAEGRLSGLITVKDISKTIEYPQATKDERGRLRVGAAVGVRGDYLDRARALAEAGCDVLCLDIAHGHAEHAIEATRELRRTVDIEIIAGNVATAEGARDLIAAGAHGIKVGVGPGSVCTTRLVAGVGVPQLTAIMDVAPVCHEAGIPLCGDGGIRMPADMSKAIGAGADTIMVGNLLAGTSESPGTLLKRDGRTVKVHRGMASGGAMQRRSEMDAAASRDGDQGTPTLETRWLLGRETDAGEFGQVVAEGVEAVVPYRGDTHTVLNELVGGLRSAMSYSNARTVPAFHASASFVRITAAGQVESRPHDVEV
jgi:IMP dehydrogenase